MSWWNKIEWSRLDEVVFFALACCLIVALAAAKKFFTVDVPGEAWAAAMVLCTAVARTIKRNGEGGGNGTTAETPGADPGA